LIQGLGARVNGIPLAISTVALVHADVGTILIDTGMHHTRPVVLERLSERGLSPSDIDVLVLTHLHFDHADNAALFPHCRRIVHEAEIKEAETHPDRDWGLSDHWRDTIAVPTLDVMTGDEMGLATGVTLHHLPGHRWGMIGVAVETGSETVFCGSDVAKNAREMLLGTPTPSDPDYLEIGRRSIARMLELSDVIISGHDRPVRIVDGVPRWDEDLPMALTIY
jgi:glyoxylase-like metal-dependent hydrolase (beta-lactamase superfamily II)